jgi:hypothetical protein
LSIGAVIAFPQITLDEMFISADKALYRAKENGKAQMIFLDELLAADRVRLKPSRLFTCRQQDHFHASVCLPSSFRQIACNRCKISNAFRFELLSRHAEVRYQAFKH